MARPTLSLVLPIYNEEEVIPLLHARLAEFLSKLGLDCEVVFVNDGSNDRSMEMLRGLAAHEPRYKILSFARNFGHQSAITAGVDYASGAAVVVMDADLQDPPEVVLEMVEQWRAGYDVVYAQRLTRAGESYFKLLTAKWFYRAFRAMIPIEVPLDAGDFRLMSRQVVVVLRQLRETHRFVRGIVSWIGFKQTAVLYDRPGRAAGDTKYPLRKMLRFAVDGITSFSILPLRFATYLGMVISFFSVLVAVWAVTSHLLSHTVEGWTAMVVLVSLFAGVQLLMTGILGEYVGRIYEQGKQRPLYVVSDRVNLPAQRDDDELDAYDPRASLPLPPLPEVALALASDERPHLAPPTPRPHATPGSSERPPLMTVKAGAPLQRPQTLLGVVPRSAERPPSFGTGSQSGTNTVLVPVPNPGPDLGPRPTRPVSGAVDIPPPPQFVTAPMKSIERSLSSRAPPLPPRRSERPKPPEK